MSVVLAGGGTAGHIEPALAVADALRRMDPRIPLTCLGTERGLETRLVPLRGYDLALIPPVPLPRKPSAELLSVPGRLAQAVRAAGDVLDRTRAQVVIGFGGYVATPAYLAARRRHVPIVVHDANVRAGLANRIGALFTRHVFTAHPGTKLAHATCVGIPIRKEISGLNRLAMADKAREHFGLRPDLPVLLVTGGSQGARSLNLAVLDAADEIRAAGVQVLHLLGAQRPWRCTCPPPGRPTSQLPYVDRMDLAYAAADFALCRSGALTCAELTTVGLPAAYVPLPHGNGEQRLNALPIERSGGGLIVDDAALSPQWIYEVLLPVMLDTRLVAGMSAAASRLGSRDTDDRLAAEVMGIIAGRPRAQPRGPRAVELRRGKPGQPGGPLNCAPGGAGPGALHR